MHSVLCRAEQNQLVNATRTIILEALLLLCTSHNVVITEACYTAVRHSQLPTVMDDYAGCKSNWPMDLCL